MKIIYNWTYPMLRNLALALLCISSIRQTITQICSELFVNFFIHCSFTIPNSIAYLIRQWNFLFILPDCQ